MERLTINNFLDLKNVEFDIQSINILIGPQASGKSLIAKIVYFFQDFLNETYLQSIQSNSTKKEVEQAGTATFEKYFPRYAWANQEFEIRYQINGSEIVVSKGRRKEGKKALQIDYSRDLINLHQRLKNSFSRNLEKTDSPSRRVGPRVDTFDAYFGALEECVSGTDYEKTFQRPMFIPASRSFFANLQKNVFSFLASNIDIDPFLADFGQQYESAKRLSDSKVVRRRLNRDTHKEIDSLVQEILVGRYKYEDEQDWIESASRKVNVANASSGQQESLPMLLILSTLPFILRNEFSTLFIEEPEAHLFPVSQSRIVELICVLHRDLNNRFFITTHSPYILTALNNLIMANDIVSQNGVDALEGIVDSRYRVSYESVGAYTVKKGRLQSIKDDESRLIGADVIDSVSDEFDAIFDQLVAVQQGR